MRYYPISRVSTVQAPLTGRPRTLLLDYPSIYRCLYTTQFPCTDQSRLGLFTCVSNYRPSDQPAQSLVELEPSCMVVPIPPPCSACPCHPRLHDAYAEVGAAGGCIYCTI